MTSEERPDIATLKTGDELRRWYWLKAELVAYCRAHDIPYNAGKFELIERIAHYLDAGEVPRPKRNKTASKFNWATEPLTVDTVITDSYKNTENMRAFMLEHIGPRFRFNIAFMNWMKAHSGQTLSDALDAWLTIEAQQEQPDFQTDIADHNQYNQYLRDFFADNPTLTMKEARICWQHKRTRPSADGRHRYAPADLAAL